MSPITKRKVQRELPLVPPSREDRELSRVEDPPCGRLDPKNDERAWEQDLKIEQDALKDKLMCKKQIHRSPMAFSAVPYERNRIFMGFEWEIIARNEKNISYKIYQDQLVANPNLHPYMGSYYDEGDIELMTTPCTLEFHRRYLDKHFFTKDSIAYQNILNNERNKSFTGIGLHVHIDLRAFNHHTLAKFLAFYKIGDVYNFIHNIAERQWYPPDVPMTLERRKGTTGSSIKSINMSPLNLKDIQEGFYQKEDERKRPLEHTRGCSFNLRCHAEKTIEVRMFKTAHSRENLYEKLELVDASVRFTRGTQIKDLNLQKFCRFIELNPKRYPHLLKHFEVQRILHNPDVYA